MKIKKLSGEVIQTLLIIGSTVGTIVAACLLGYSFVKDGLAENRKSIEKLEMKVGQLEMKVDKGFSESRAETNDRIDKLEEKVDKRFDKVDKRFDKMEKDFDKLAEKVDDVENTLIGHTAGHSHFPMIDTTAPAVEKDAAVSAALLPEKAEESAAQEPQQ